MRHIGVGYGVYHLAAVLDDTTFLVLLTHHVAGDVMEEQQRNVASVTELNKLRGLLCGF